jgi:D-alanyl-D-alanine carboxypeptidase (penicillin-binding protein 5/6)
VGNPQAERIPDRGTGPEDRGGRGSGRAGGAGRGLFGSRLGLKLGLMLAGVATLGSSAWAMSTSGPRPYEFGGTVVAGDSDAAAVPTRLVQTASDDFVYPGKLDLAWPGSGAAAIEVDGMGLLGHSGSMTSRHAIASITKTMTAYVILKDHPLSATSSGPTITLNGVMDIQYAIAVKQDESAVVTRLGERITERQALQALLLASAGNMADILAIWDRGSVGSFLTEMNQQARSLGMTGSSFTDPAGLASSTVSTMGDLLKLAEAVQHVPAMTSIVAENSADVPVAGTIYNVNRDLGSYGIDGIKTGTTSAAGSCLLFSAHVRVGGRTLTVLGVVLGTPGSSGIPYTALNAARKLVASAEAQIGRATVAGPGKVVAALEQGHARVASLGVADPVSVVGWPGLGYRVTVSGDAAAPTLGVTRTGGSSAAAQTRLVRLRGQDTRFGNTTREG